MGAKSPLTTQQKKNSTHAMPVIFFSFLFSLLRAAKFFSVRAPKTALAQKHADLTRGGAVFATTESTVAVLSDTAAITTHTVTVCDALSASKALTLSLVSPASKESKIPSILLILSGAVKSPLVASHCLSAPFWYLSWSLEKPGLCSRRRSLA